MQRNQLQIDVLEVLSIELHWCAEVTTEIKTNDLYQRLMFGYYVSLRLQSDFNGLLKHGLKAF